MTYKQLTGLIALSLAVGLFGQGAASTPAPPVSAQPSAPVPPLGPITLLAPNSGAGQFSAVAAVGGPTTAPRHLAAAIGFSESVSATQDFFLTVTLAPKSGAAVNELGVLLGMAQDLPGTINLAGHACGMWASAAFGTSLSNASKINLTSTPAGIVASASTNAAFAAEYAGGLLCATKWPNVKIGPGIKYDHVSGDPSKAIVALTIKLSPKP